METAIFKFEMLILLLANILNPTNIRVVLWQKYYLINNNDAECCDHGTVCYQWWSGHSNDQSYSQFFLTDMFQACSFLFLWLLLLPVCATGCEVDIPWISRTPRFFFIRYVPSLFVFIFVVVVVFYNLLYFSHLFYW